MQEMFQGKPGPPFPVALSTKCPGGSVATRVGEFPIKKIDICRVQNIDICDLLRTLVLVTLFLG